MNRENRFRAIALKLQTIPRILTVTIALLPFVISFLRDRRRYIWRGKPRSLTREQHARRAHRLVSVFAFLGPTFIKMSQVFAIREDVLPKVYADAFKRLLDQAPVVSFKQVRRHVEAALGAPLEKTFERFDVEPLASASIAQVHRARYHGEEVVIKLRRPGVVWLIDQDITTIGLLMRLMKPFYGQHSVWRGLNTIITESKRMVKRELDFRCEAENAERIRRENVSPRLVIPVIYPECTREDVLVLEYCEGIRIDRTDELKAQGVKLLPLMETLMEMFLRQVLVNCFFHADPHPGNIMIDREGRVVLLDFGMVEELSPALRDDLLALIMAAVNNDPDMVIKKLYAVGMIEPSTDHAELVKAAEIIIELRTMKGIPRRQVNLAVEKVFTEMHELPKVHLPSQFVYLMRMATLLEGIALKFDPDFSTIRDGLPVAKRVAFWMLIGTTPWQKVAKYAVEITVDVTKKYIRNTFGEDTFSDVLSSGANALTRGARWLDRVLQPAPAQTLPQLPPAKEVLVTAKD